MPPETPALSQQRTRPLDADERAELNELRDLRARVIGFGGDDFTIAPWIDAHKLHKDEPYIGCPFCRDEFVRRNAADDQRLEAWREGFDAAGDLVDVAAAAGHARPELARAVAHSRDDLEARYVERMEAETDA
jgi:hypothetical protein